MTKIPLVALIFCLLISAVAQAQVCDGITDDAPAINAAATTLPCHSRITLPQGARCRINETIALTTCTGFDGNGALLDASHLAGNLPAMTISSQTPGANYLGNRVAYRNITLVGNRAATGLLIAASNFAIDGLNVQGFGTGLSFGNHGYSVTFHNFEIIGNTIGIFYPPNLFNAGEQISFDGGSIANSTTAGLLLHAGKFNFSNTTFDFDGRPLVDYGAAVSLTNDYFEGFTVPPIQVGGTVPVNAYVHVIVNQTEFFTDHYMSLPLVQINSGYAQVSHAFLSGFANPAGLVSGAAVSQASLCGLTSGAGPLGNVPNEGICP